MPIQDSKYVTPAWQNGGPPAITAEELTAIGQSIEQNQDNIEQNATDIQTANNNIQTANNNIQQNKQDIDSLQTWQSTINGQISSIQSGYLQKTGGTMTGILNMGNKRIANLATPSSGTDAVNKNYVDNNFLSQMTLVQIETFSASADKTQQYRFSSAFANLQTSYQFMIVAVSGTVSKIGDGVVSLFKDQLFYPGNTNTYVVSSNNPVTLLLAKHGLDYSDDICYCGILSKNVSSNIVQVADKNGNPYTFEVVLTNVNTSSPSVSLTIKLYGWNPI